MSQIRDKKAHRKHITTMSSINAKMVQLIELHHFCVYCLLSVSLSESFHDAAYLHHWLSVTIHFNRYNLRFYKYTECRDKCKSLYFIVLHIRVVPPSFSPFVECPLSDARCWTIGHFRMDVTERLLNTKVVLFLEFLRFAVGFFALRLFMALDSLEKV